LALPDALYMPFAENYDLIGLVLDNALSGEEYAEALPRIKALAERMEAGRRVIVDAPPTQRRCGLTRREHEAVSLKAEGFSYGEIAKQLSISPNTVKTHLNAAHRKTGTSSRPALKQILKS
jgi:LuxR family maltose regulon positive regulatory protein